MDNRFDIDEVNQPTTALAGNRFDVDEPTIQQAGVDFSTGRMISNIPGSAMNIVADTGRAVLNPVETAQAIGGLAMSGVELMGRKLAEFTTGSEIAPREGKEDQIRAVGGYIKNRYGSVDGFKTALMDDPVGVLLDVSATGVFSKIPKVANIAKYGEMGTALKTVMPKNVVEKLYQSAAKFNLTNKVTPEVRRANINTAVEYGIMPTTSGYIKIRGTEDILNSQMDDLIKDHMAKTGYAPGNATVPVESIMRHFPELRKDIGSIDANAAEKIAKINKWEESMRNQWGSRTHITVEELQKFKKRAYEDVATWGKKKQGKKKGTETAGRGAKETLVEHIPEAAEINRQLSQLYRLQPELRAAANRVDKAPIVPLGSKLTGAAVIGGGAWLGSPVLGVSVALAEALMANAKFRAGMAIAIGKMKGTGAAKYINDNINTPEVRIALAMAGRAEESAEKSAVEQESQ